MDSPASAQRTTPEGIRFGRLAIDVDVLRTCKDIENLVLEITFGLLPFIALLLMNTAQDSRKHLQDFCGRENPIQMTDSLAILRRFW
jgi:hypothetical protein